VEILGLAQRRRPEGARCVATRTGADVDGGCLSAEG
jgi:hypothetical protein